MRTKYEIEEKLNNINISLGQSLNLAGGYARAREAMKQRSYDDQTLLDGANVDGQKETLEWVLADKNEINNRIEKIESELRSLKSTIRNY